MAWHSHRAGLQPRAALAPALALVLLTLAACGGGDSSPTASPSPTSSLPTPLGSPTVTPTPPPPSTPYRFLYREFGREQDTIWRVLPSDPSQREEMAVIPHRADWGIVPSLSPDGKRLAYLTLPERAVDRGSEAEAYILDLESGQTELIAQGVDLQLRPLWSPDGELLYLRRIAQMEREVTILQVQVPGAGEEQDSRIEPILKADLSDVLTFIPIGFADDERSMYFVQISAGSGGGTLLGAYAPATAPAPLPPPSPTPQATFVVHLSDQIARDYDLSPDSKRLSFLVQELIEGQLLFRAFVADLVGGIVEPLPTEGLQSGGHLRPLWRPDGSRISVGLLPSPGEPGAVALLPLDGGVPSFLPPPDLGFDVPLSWAPDGSYLAVTSFDGESLDNRGRARLVLVAPSGQRINVAEGVDVEVVGWVKAE